jgi:hypothetical protein
MKEKLRFSQALTLTVCKDKAMMGMLAILQNGALKWGVDRKAKFCAPIMMLFVVLMLAVPGCALHHYDKATGTEHIWGLGYMKMKVAPPREGLQAVVRGTDVFGLSLGIGEQQNYLTAGWHRTQRLDVVAESTAIRYEWPDSDFAKVRIGSKFPFQPASEIPDSNEQSESEL